jgi:hypothetical protein
MQLVQPITALLATIAIIAALFLMPRAEQADGASITQFLNLSAPTTTAAFAVTTSARILATTTSVTGTSYQRVYATICNPNANPVALYLGQDVTANATAGRTTTWIAAAAGYNACFEITDRNGYNGSVTASSTGQTSTTITVTDYVY